MSVPLLLVFPYKKKFWLIKLAKEDHRLCKSLQASKVPFFQRLLQLTLVLNLQYWTSKRKKIRLIFCHHTHLGLVWFYVNTFDAFILVFEVVCLATSSYQLEPFSASVPLPIVAAIYCVLFSFVSSTSLSFLQFCNLNRIMT